jgi:predicted PurR-regulated permease PerM
MAENSMQTTPEQDPGGRADKDVGLTQAPAGGASQEQRSSAGGAPQDADPTASKARAADGSETGWGGDRGSFRVVAVILLVALLYALRDGLYPALLASGVLLLLVMGKRRYGFEQGMGVLVAVIFGSWVMHEIAGLLWPFALSFVLAYLLAPLVDLLGRRLTRTGASLLVMFVLIGALVATGVVLIPKVIDEVRDLVGRMPVYEATARALLDRMLASLRSHGYELSVSEIQARVLDRLPEVSNLVAAQTISLLKGISSGVTAIVNLGIIPFVTFYIAKDYHEISSGLQRIFPDRHRDAGAALMARLSKVIGQYFRGQLIVCAFLATFTSLGLAFFGIRYAIILGVLAGISNLVPYIGYAVVLGVTTLIALMEPDPLWSLVKVLVVFVSVQAAEGNLITPRVVGKRIGLHPVWVVFSLMMAAHFWGFMAMIIALPVAALVNILAHVLAERYFVSGYYKQGHGGPHQAPDEAAAPDPAG